MKANARRAAILLTLALLPIAYDECLAAGAKTGFTKTFLLFRQPDASAPPELRSRIWEDLQAEEIAEYGDATLIYLPMSASATLISRAQEARSEVIFRDNFDVIRINGRGIDARLGTATSLGPLRFDPPYSLADQGSWIIQFAGPIKPEWSQALHSRGIVIVQFLPSNAAIIAGWNREIETLRAHPFVQFLDQLHRVFKPTLRMSAGAQEELWIQVADTGDTEAVRRYVRSLSVAGISEQRWSPTELRLEGTFRKEDLEAIESHPLVIAISGRPTIVLSDERARLSLTEMPLRGGTYKKWLADTCGAACLNLDTRNFNIGIADVGVSGGFFAASPSPSVNDPPSSGLAHEALPFSRLFRGNDFGIKAGTVFSSGGPFYPDSTNSLHDVLSHGTFVASVAAGDPPLFRVDSTGFLLGIGVAPSAGLVITKINP